MCTSNKYSNNQTLEFFSTYKKRVARRHLCQEKDLLNVIKYMETHLSLLEPNITEILQYLDLNFLQLLRNFNIIPHPTLDKWITSLHRTILHTFLKGDNFKNLELRFLKKNNSSIFEILDLQYHTFYGVNLTITLLGCLSGCFSDFVMISMDK